MVKRWLVRKPVRNYWRYHLNIDAEERAGQEGEEVEAGRFFYGTERRLRFPDGTEHWYYQPWLKRVTEAPNA